MHRSTIALLLVAGLITGSLVLPTANASVPSGALISVNRTTTIYPNYAVSTDTIRVINGSVSSLVAQFPTNTTVLRVTGPDVLYAYQLSSSPTREVVVFRNQLSAGSSTQIEYVYTGFISSGQLQIGFQAGYSVTSVNDSASYYYGVQKWGPTLRIFYNNRYVNVTQGETFFFNGTTAANSYVTASNPSTSSVPTSYQAYIQTLSRHVVYGDGVFHVDDQVVFVWASSAQGRSLYLFVPNNLVNRSVSVSYFYGTNVSSTLKYNAFSGYSLLVINSPIQLARGQSVGLHLSYDVKGDQLNFSAAGLYGMFCYAYSVTADDVRALEGNWTSTASGYFVAFRDITAQDMGAYSVAGVSSTNFADGASLAVLIVGVFAAASSYAYTQTKNRRKTKRTVPQTVIKSLTASVSTIESVYDTVKRFLEGEVKAPVAAAALASFDEMRRRLTKEISESKSRGELSEAVANKLMASLKDIRDSLADLIELQTGFNQKRLRQQSVYLRLKSEYQKNLQRALNMFKETVSDLKGA